MFEQLRARITHVRGKIRDIEKLQGQSRELTAALNEERTLLRPLIQRLAKEKEDVDKLDRLSWTSVFASILGDKVEKRDKEREEYLAAKLAYDERRSAVDDLEEDLARVDNQIQAYGDPRGELEQLLQEKERVLASSDDPRAQRLIALAEESAELTADAKEVSEALASGRAAARALVAAEADLRSASNWGVVDIVGGGILTTAIKHSKIGDSRSAIRRARQLLRRFNAELLDLKTRFELKVDIGNVASFADYLVDGLIVDFYVQSKIGNARTSIMKVRRRVRVALTRLERTDTEVRTRLEIIESERRQLVEQA